MRAFLFFLSCVALDLVYAATSNSSDVPLSYVHSISFAPLQPDDTTQNVEARMHSWLQQNQQLIEIINMETVIRPFGDVSEPSWTEVTAAWDTYTHSVAPYNVKHELYEITFMEVRRIWYFNLSAKALLLPSTSTSTVTVPPTVVERSAATHNMAAPLVSLILSVVLLLLQAAVAAHGSS